MHRYRITFMAGLAAGFVVGTRAGRERYEQMKKLARSAADSPAVQQAAGAVQAQAAEVLKSARVKVTGGLQERVPKMAESAKHAVGDHIPGMRGKGGKGKGGKDAHLKNGTRSSERPFVSASGHSAGGAIS